MGVHPLPVLAVLLVTGDVNNPPCPAKPGKMQGGKLSPDASYPGGDGVLHKEG